MAIDFIENCPYDEIRVGQSAELQRTLTRDDIVLFGKVSGDLNPTHMDPEFARDNATGGITGHSLWNSGLISSLLGNVLPGPGTVFRQQTMQFHRPVHLGDRVTARVKVREKRDEQVVLFDCDALNQRGETVMTGIAEITAPKEKISVPKAELPEISVRHHDSYTQLIEEAASLEPIPTAIKSSAGRAKRRRTAGFKASGSLRPKGPRWTGNPARLDRTYERDSRLRASPGIAPSSPVVAPRRGGRSVAWM